MRQIFKKFSEQKVTEFLLGVFTVTITNTVTVPLTQATV